MSPQFPAPDGRMVHTYAMQGDTAKAKAAYQDFLTLWKDADPDIPIFIAAKAEYAKLQSSRGELARVVVSGRLPEM
jgi:hypothetical protein